MTVDEGDGPAINWLRTGSGAIVLRDSDARGSPGMTTAIEVRVLEPHEAERLDAVAAGVFDDPVVAERAREFLGDSRHHLAVALDGGTVVGMASAVHYLHPDKEGPELWINEVGVAPTHQGQGIGRRLLAALFARAAEVGCLEAWVLTHPDNVAACRMYEGVGGVVNPAPIRMYAFSLES